MAYNQLIPIGTDDLSVSQPQMQDNFLAIFNAFNLNHGKFNSGTEGKHAFVEMPNQSAALPTIDTNEVGFFCNTSTFTTEPELFYAKQSGSSAPISLRTPYSISDSNYIADGGWSRLPSGILLKWGVGTAVSGTSLTVDFPAATSIPVYTNIYQVYVTDQTNPPRLYSVTTIIAPGGGHPTGAFTVITVGASGLGFRWLAIGI